MNIVYNTPNDFATSFRNFLDENTTCLHKPQKNFLPDALYGIIVSESLVSGDVALKLKGKYSLIQSESVSKRFTRLMRNKRYKGHKLFDEIIRYTINNLKLKHDDKRIHITIDHMYSKENYTVLMATMRVGKQGIPICFETFEGINNSDAYVDELLIKFVKQIDNLFKDKDVDLIFLADRWFNSYNLLKTIDDLNHTYVIRLKGNINIKVLDKKEGHMIKKQTGDLFAYQCHSCFYEKVQLYEEHEFTTNIVRSKKEGVKEPWILATNGNHTRAIKDYGYRFGSIEPLFKNQKSNCFRLETTVNASLTYFDNLYSTMCIAILLLTCIGADYSKNKSCYKKVQITTHKVKNKKKVRVISIFKTGLILFKMAINSLRYIRLKINFILYDV